jgi:hypothetical protein
MKATTMGMDVFGKNPKNKTGEYFRRNVWGWRPLATLCVDLAPDTCAACEHWQSNDGDGLEEDGAAELAGVLQKALKSGKVEQYLAAREEVLAAMPDEPCLLCDGSGIRNDPLGRMHGMHKERITEPDNHPRYGQIGTCNGCNGVGHRRPLETWFELEVEDVREFAAFLKASGGFAIH